MRRMTVAEIKASGGLTFEQKREAIEERLLRARKRAAELVADASAGDLVQELAHDLRFIDELMGENDRYSRMVHARQKRLNKRLSTVVETFVGHMKRRMTGADEKELLELQRTFAKVERDIADDRDLGGRLIS